MIRSPSTDRNPARVRCALCGDTDSWHERVAMLPGSVCASCLGAAAPESAPYWQEWESICRISERSTAPFVVARRRAAQAQRARERKAVPE